ncbi:PAS domain-containing protein [Amycolatopsis sp. NPDC004079]|uniref:PAS domain-containing protein n=1 Tax=Amycolatopsis sp. NPDC004079 TaxID=3154549 RepID=UPI00339E1247
MHELLRSVSGNPLFTATSSAYLLLDADLRIQAANPAYLRATGRQFDELVGSFMFDAFPDNPADTGATGVRNLGASLERVMRRGLRDDMGVQRYDIPDPAAPDRFRFKTWSPVNSPLLDAAGRVAGTLHHVEDITVVHDVLRDAAGAELADGKRQPAAVLRRAMLAVTQYDRALADAKAALARVPVRTSSSDATRRDKLWHRVVHSARSARPGGCAAAICAAASEELPGIDAAVLTLHDSELVHYDLAASSLWGQRVEELQWLTGDGPSLAASAGGGPVLVPDLVRFGAAWPAFTDVARSIGVTAVFAYPLRTATASPGTLTLYRRNREAREGDAPADAEAFAEFAAIVLLADLDTEIIQEVRAAADEADVNIAIGLVMSAQRVAAPQAQAWLRGMAEARGEPLVEIARQFVAGRLNGS